MDFQVHIYFKMSGKLISTECSGAIVFFHNSLQPLSRLHGLYNQYQLSAGEGEVATFREFLEKTQYLMNTL